MIMVKPSISKALCGRVRSLSVLTFQTVEDEQTMRNISDIIEQYLKSILQESPEGTVEIQRNDLAEQFSCVPSQINYVISTRFTLEKGFLVESKRGGGGYIRIQRIELPQHTALQQHLHHTIGSMIDQTVAEGLIYQLEESRFLTRREASLMRAAISRECLNVKLPYRDELRARIMKAMLISLLGK
ncbi:transcriptional regulator CtsR [Bifidobacterium pullorum subsp. gallinarum]